MKIVNIGAMVVLSDHPTAQIYTVTETYSSGTRVMATLKYLSEYGKACFGGNVDVSSLLTPTAEQMSK